MCRMLLASKNAITSYDKAYGLRALLKHLEDECGGDGIGYVIVKDGLIQTYFRSCSKDRIAKATKALLRRNYDYALFHTRLASLGSVSVANCHPFVSDTRTAMAMNGTIASLALLSQATEKTDTELLFNTVSKMSISNTITTLRKLAPAFIGICEGRPYLVKNLGDMVEWTYENLDKHNDFFFVSSLPSHADDGKLFLPDSFTWIDGTSLPYDNDAPTPICDSYGMGLIRYNDAYDEGYLDGYTTALAGKPFYEGIDCA